MDSKREIEALKASLADLQEENERLQNDIDWYEEQNYELEDKVTELETQLVDNSSLVDLEKLITRMKIDNIYTSEFDEWLDNYFKFYDKGE